MINLPRLPIVRQRRVAQSLTDLHANKNATKAFHAKVKDALDIAVTAGGQLLPTESAGGIIEYVKAEDLEKMENFVDYGPQDEMPSEEAFDIF